MRQTIIGLTAAAAMLTAYLASAAAAPPGTADGAEGSSPFQLSLELVAEGLTAPVDLVSPPGGDTRRFVVDQVGLIHIISPAGEMLPRPFLDIRDRIVPLIAGFDERGLLGFAFHPGYAENGRFFVSYSAPLRTEAPDGWNYTRRVSEFTVSPDDPDQADPRTERVLLEQDWPSRKHNGGGLAFGPDGNLYIGFGDSGAVHGVGQDVLYEAFEVPEAMGAWDRFAQDTSSLYGKILRIDVDRGYPRYAVPPLNPLAGGLGREEIYAWGFRNPYRLSFDGDTLFVTAVGETLWESVYMVDKSGNYGWPIREATHCFDRQLPKTPPSKCPSAGALGEPLIDPVIEYPNMSIERDGVGVKRRGVGTAVVGGHIYRGEALAELRGKYVFGDWSHSFAEPSGQVFVASPSPRWGELWSLEKALDVDSRVLSLGRDSEGELYVLTNNELGPFGNTGKVYKLVRGPR